MHLVARRPARPYAVASRALAERVAAFDLGARRGRAADGAARARGIAAAALGDVAAARDDRRTLRRRHQASGRSVAVCRCRPGGAARSRLATLGVAALAVEADLARAARLSSAGDGPVGRGVGAVTFLRHAGDEQATQDPHGRSNAKNGRHAGHLRAEGRARRAPRAATPSNDGERGTSPTSPTTPDVTNFTRRPSASGERRPRAHDEDVL